MDALIRMPDKGLARVSAANAGGLAQLEEIMADIAEPLVIADRCRKLMLDGDFPYVGRAPHVDQVRLLATAKRAHGEFLSSFAAVKHAHQVLKDIVVGAPRFPLTHVTASKMLTVLFGAFSRKRADDANSAIKLAACADMFTPVSNIVGVATGLWKPVSTHPVVLALAIKRLFARKVFEPSECELREAMQEAWGRLLTLADRSEEWIKAVARADEIIFELDRPAWQMDYANVGSSVPLMMQDELGEDDAPTQTPRWRALNELWEARYAIEEAAELARLVEAESKHRRIAACKPPVAKRTKRGEG